MNSTNTDSLRERTHRTTVQLAYWTGAWVLTLAAAVFGPVFVWDSKGMTLGMIIVNVAVGIGMIVANKRHLDVLDELQRKIQLEAMALALGVALVAGLGYSTLDITNVIAMDAEISYLVMLVSVTYLAGILLGRRKFQ